jgi:hypothetical protein
MLDDTQKHLIVHDLLAMPEDERQALLEKAITLAADDDFDICEANEIIDDDYPIEPGR